MKVVLLADSLALPRGADWGNVAYEETYPYVLDFALRSRYPDRQVVLMERGMRFRTINAVLDDWKEFVELRSPDILIVHVGVVDCAPRVFSAAERRIVSSALPSPLRSMLLKFVHRWRSQIIRVRSDHRYVTEADFQRAVRKLVSPAASGTPRLLVIVNILSPGDDMESRSPGYRANVARYNAMLAAEAGGAAELVDYNKLVSDKGGVDRLTVDGMHPNREGHRLLATALLNAIVKKFG